MSAHRVFSIIQISASLSCALVSGAQSDFFNLAVFLAGFAVFAFAAWREPEGVK